MRRAGFDAAGGDAGVVEAGRGLQASQFGGQEAEVAVPEWRHHRAVFVQVETQAFDLIE